MASPRDASGAGFDVTMPDDGFGSADAALADSFSPNDSATSDDTAAGGDSAVDPDVCPPPSMPILPGDPLVIPTREGPVVGVLNDGVRSWLGVPYAAPPLGAGRFAAPQPPVCRSGPLVAAAFGPKCPQTLPNGAVVGAEDCLQLNLWAPAPTAEDPGPWPVAVFVHGGGSVQGSASETLPGGEALYDGQFLARFGRVVVVTVQYRLGAPGWLALPDGDGVAPANRGLLDQQQALRWLQVHVGAFGGDPARTLLFGESAGAVHTGLHLVAEGSDGLFSTALLQSGTPRATPWRDAETFRESMLGPSACGDGDDVLACLRDLPIEVLLRTFPGIIRIGEAGLGSGASTLGPVIDGRIIVEEPNRLLQKKAESGALPLVVIGSNTEEMAELLTLQVADWEAFDAAVRTHIAPPFERTSGLDADAILGRIKAVYALENYTTAQDALADLYTDLRFTCPAEALADTLVKAGSPVKRYLFARRAETRNGPQPATHGRELVYVFGSWRLIPLYRPAEADAAVSAAMLGAWAALAGGNEVDAGPGLRWPDYTMGVGETVVFDEKTRIESRPRAERCAMWQALATPAATTR